MRPLLRIVGSLICLSLSLDRATADAARNRAIDQYQMELMVMPADSRVDGKMMFHWWNDSGQARPAVRLRLDPNLGTKQSIEIDSVMDAEGNSLRWHYEPIKFANFSSDKGAVEIELAEPARPQEETVLAIGFHNRWSHFDPELLVLQGFLSVAGWLVSKGNVFWQGRVVDR